MKKITIENLLIWAFTQELPKVGSQTLVTPGFSINAGLERVEELGTLIDETMNRFGVVPGYIYEGDPHPDAVVVGNAVRALDQHTGFDVGEGWNPFPEWDDQLGLIAEEVSRIVRAETVRESGINGRRVVTLVTIAAVMKTGPDWTADPPKVSMVMRSNGRPAWFVRKKVRTRAGWEEVEDDGLDRKKQKPMPNAYRKFRLEHSIRSVTVSRMDWQLWQSALEALFDSLSGRLSDHELLPFEPNRHPWIGNSKPPRVLQVIEKAELY
jgi:hypothetical protein